MGKTTDVDGKDTKMKIIEIRTTPLGLRFKKPYHWAGRVDLGSAAVLVEVETDEGIVGIGESTATFPAEGVLNILRGVSPLFLGESPFDIERLFFKARFLGGLNHPARFANMVLAGLEMALWDIIGKAAGRPVYQLVGGAFRSEVDYFGFLQGDTADQLVDSAEQAVAAGYSVIYMKVGRGEEKDLQNVAAVREIIGDRRLRLDANEAWDPATAIRMIHRLAPFEPDFIEQPTPSQSIPALKQVKSAVNVPIAADQCVFTLAEVNQVCQQQAADVIVLSPHETGGLLAFRKAAAVAEAAGIPICLHGQSVSGITDCAQHHLGLSLPNLTDGNQIMHQLQVEDLISAPDITPKKGKIGLLDGPGLGFQLNPDAVARAAERYRQDDYYHHV
jgi:L-alanine-DL-glutamate epimerase-like enolase superfamily enzyme